MGSWLTSKAKRGEYSALSQWNIKLLIIRQFSFVPSHSLLKFYRYLEWHFLWLNVYRTYYPLPNQMKWVLIAGQLSPSSFCKQVDYFYCSNHVLYWFHLLNLFSVRFELVMKKLSLCVCPLHQQKEMLQVLYFIKVSNDSQVIALGLGKNR